MSEVAAVASLEADWDTFCSIESDVTRGESIGVEARWRCGRLLLTYEKRQGSKNSPLAEVVRKLSGEFGVSERELLFRRQFAEEQPEEQDFCTAVQKFGSWTDIRESLGRRKKYAPVPPPPLPVGVWDVLLADPPWRYEGIESPDLRAVENQYPTLTVEEICALEVPAAEDAVLFLWATAPKLVEALQVVDAWGFEYRTNAVWVKDRIGMGYYFRGRHELLLVGRRGDPGTPEESNRRDSVIEAPRGKHSEKPEIVHEIIEAAYPGRSYLELFSRRECEGWDSWGHQA